MPTQASAYGQAAPESRFCPWSADISLLLVQYARMTSAKGLQQATMWKYAKAWLIHLEAGSSSFVISRDRAEQVCIQAHCMSDIHGYLELNYSTTIGK